MPSLSRRTRQEQTLERHGGSGRALLLPWLWKIASRAALRLPQEEGTWRSCVGFASTQQLRRGWRMNLPFTTAVSDDGVGWTLAIFVRKSVLVRFQSFGSLLTKPPRAHIFRIFLSSRVSLRNGTRIRWPSAAAAVASPLTLCMAPAEETPAMLLRPEAPGRYVRASFRCVQATGRQHG